MPPALRNGMESYVVSNGLVAPCHLWVVFKRVKVASFTN